MLLTLQGPGNSGTRALLFRAPGGFTNARNLQTPPTALGFRPVKGFFFVFFTEPLTSGLAPVESSSLFPSAPRTGSEGLEVAEQAKSRALGEFWSQRTNHFSFDIEVTGEGPRPLATLSTR